MVVCSRTLNSSLNTAAVLSGNYGGTFGQLQFPLVLYWFTPSLGIESVFGRPPAVLCHGDVAW